MKTKRFGWRTNGADGEFEMMVHDHNAALSAAFARVAKQMVADGFIRPDWTSGVRYEGKVKIGKRSYPCISQSNLIVVAGPTPPAHVKITFQR